MRNCKEYEIELRQNTNEKKKIVIELSRTQGEGGGRGVNFYWICAAGFSEPLPHCRLWSIIDSILVTFGQICNFRDPN